MDPQRLAIPTIAVYPDFGIPITTNALPHRFKVTRIADVASTLAGRQAVLVDLADHLGVKTASDHHEKQPAIGKTRVKRREAALDERSAHPLRSGREAKVLGEQVGGAYGKQRNRHTRCRSIGQFGRRSVAARSDQGSEPALPMELVGLLGDLAQVRQGFDAKTSFLQQIDESIHASAYPAAPGFGIDRNEHMIGDVGNPRCEVRKVGLRKSVPNE